MLQVWSRFFDDPVDWWAIVEALVPTLIIGWGGAVVARWLATSALRAFLGDSLPSDSPLIRTLLRIVFITAWVLIIAVLLFPAFDITGLHPKIGRTLSDISTWVFSSGLRIMLIVLVAYALCRTTDLVVSRFEHELTDGASLDSLEHTKRARTLGYAVNKIVTILIIAIAVVTILNELGVNVGPVLTGAGIAGLSIGIGAQSLVKDVLNGFFLILEDQVRVGDDVEINGTSGLVEQINLRTIVLRDIRGTVHVFPHGSVDTIANQSKDFSHYVIDLNISFKEDPDRVSSVVHDVDRDLRSDPDFAPLILQPAQVHGVVGFSDWAMQLRIQIKTLPQKQWAVGREFRKRLRMALNRAGIENPYPALRRPS